MPAFPIKGRDLGNMVGLKYSQVTSRLQILIEKGLVVRVDRGVFVRKDALGVWGGDLKPERPDPTVEADTVLAALKDGPKSIREIGFAVNGELSSSIIRKYLTAAREAGQVEYANRSWTLKTAA